MQEGAQHLFVAIIMVTIIIKLSVERIQLMKQQEKMKPGINIREKQKAMVRHMPAAHQLS